MHSLLKFSAICALSVLPMLAQGSWVESRDKFIEEQGRSFREASRTLIEIGKTKDQAAISFVRDIYESKPRFENGLTQKYPDMKPASSYPGIAQVALIESGDRVALRELIDQTTHRDPGVRKDALEKLKLTHTDQTIKALSSFIGDEESYGNLSPLEWAALFEMSQRLETPPSRIDNSKDLGSYYEGGGREKWLKWRYETYGPIPGREDLFSQFTQAAVSNLPSQSGVDSILPKTAIADTLKTRKETDVAALADPALGQVHADSSDTNWLLYGAGALCLAAATGWVLMRRKKAR